MKIVKMVFKAFFSRIDGKISDNHYGFILTLLVYFMIEHFSEMIVSIVANDYRMLASVSIGTLIFWMIMRWIYAKVDHSGRMFKIF